MQDPALQVWRGSKQSKQANMQQPCSTNTVLAQTSIQAPILSCTSVPSMIGHNSPIWTDNHIHDSMIMTGTESGFQTPPVQASVAALALSVEIWLHLVLSVLQAMTSMKHHTQELKLLH